MRRLTRIAPLLATLLLSACGAPTENAPPHSLERSAGVSPAPQEVSDATTGGRIVALVHSDLPAEGAPNRVSFASTLVIQNADDQPVTVTRIDLIAVDGVTAHAYLPAPLHLAPGARLRAFAASPNAGAAAFTHFVVEWAGQEPPHVQAIMLGAAGTHGYSVVSQGQALR